MVGTIICECVKPIEYGHSIHCPFYEIEELRSALRTITAAAQSWHDFHHGSNDIQCDAICEALPAARAALRPKEPSYDERLAASKAGAALVALRRKSQKVCAVCGKTFSGIATAVYCSNACRQRAKYRRSRQ